LGDGKNVKFCDDRWVEDIVLKKKYPRLFSISKCKDSLVSDLVISRQIMSNGGYSWNLGWRKERFV